MAMSFFGTNDMTESIFWISMDALYTQYPVRNIDPASCRRRNWLNVGGQVWTLRFDIAIVTETLRVHQSAHTLLSGTSSHLRYHVYSDTRTTTTGCYIQIQGQPPDDLWKDDGRKNRSKIRIP
jgi:hypothetical protein